MQFNAFIDRARASVSCNVAGETLADWGKRRREWDERAQMEREQWQTAHSESDESDESMGEEGGDEETDEGALNARRATEEAQRKCVHAHARTLNVARAPWMSPILVPVDL
jgi:hypothetical protein